MGKVNSPAFRKFQKLLKKKKKKRAIKFLRGLCATKSLILKKLLKKKKEETLPCLRGFHVTTLLHKNLVKRDKSLYKYRRFVPNMNGFTIHNNLKYFKIKPTIESKILLVRSYKDNPVINFNNFMAIYNQDKYHFNRMVSNFNYNRYTVPKLKQAFFKRFKMPVIKEPKYKNEKAYLDRSLLPIENQQSFNTKVTQDFDKEYVKFKLFLKTKADLGTDKKIFLESQQRLKRINNYLKVVYRRGTLKSHIVHLKYLISCFKGLRDNKKDKLDEAKEKSDFMETINKFIKSKNYYVNKNKNNPNFKKDNQVLIKTKNDYVNKNNPNSKKHDQDLIKTKNFYYKKDNQDLAKTEIVNANLNNPNYKKKKNDYYANKNNPNYKKKENDYYANLNNPNLDKKKVNDYYANLNNPNYKKKHDKDLTKKENDSNLNKNTLNLSGDALSPIIDLLNLSKNTISNINKDTSKLTEDTSNLTKHDPKLKKKFTRLIKNDPNLNENNDLNKK